MATTATGVKIDRCGFEAIKTHATIPSSNKQLSQLDILSDLVHRLDSLIHPEGQKEALPTQEQLKDAEKDLREMYERVTWMRRQLQLPPLTLVPEDVFVKSRPSTVQSVTLEAPSRSRTSSDECLPTYLEWKDIVERVSDNLSYLTLKFSSDIVKSDMINFFLINGQKIEKPVNGWAEDCGPHVVYRTKRPTSLVIVLNKNWCPAAKSDGSGAMVAIGQREIHYAIVMGRNELGTTSTIPRSFKVRRH